jgi:hypothetical protein
MTRNRPPRGATEAARPSRKRNYGGMKFWTVSWVRVRQLHSTFGSAETQHRPVQLILERSESEKKGKPGLRSNRRAVVGGGPLRASRVQIVCAA